MPWSLRFELSKGFSYMLRATLINLQSYFSCQDLRAKFNRNWTLYSLGKMLSLNIVKHCLNVVNFDQWLRRIRVCGMSSRAARLSLTKRWILLRFWIRNFWKVQQNMKWCKPTDCKKILVIKLLQRYLVSECDRMSYWCNFFTPCRESRFLQVSI